MEIATWFLQWILLLYIAYLLIFIQILLIFTVALWFTKPGTRLNTLLCQGIVFGSLFLAPTLALPLVALRPRHPKNASILSWFIRKASYLAGFSYELRGTQHTKSQNGAVICANHQNALDLYGDMNIGQHFSRRGAVSKKSLLYVFPFGPICWLSNIIFIDRSNPKAIRSTLEQLTDIMTRKKMKILFYPEGTRNSGDGILPFKKGAFLYAIKAQVPVIPMVFAPYYFIDKKTGIYLYKQSK